jgi:hypothetical protein
MLRRFLCGSVLEKQLWGVDDPTIIAAVRRECFRRSNAWAHALLAVIAVGAVGGVFRAVLDLTLGCRGWQATLLTTFVALAAVLTSAIVLKRRAAKVLPEVLRSMGRCTHCGYRLDVHHVERCPECGHAPPSPLRS